MSSILWNLEQVALSGRLKPLTLTIQHADTVILGPSGSGKTSLLNLLVGFETPAQGRIQFHQVADQAAVPLMWVPPDFGLWPGMNAGRHLMESGASTDEARRLLEAFELSDISGLHPGQLSDGQRSRLAVARALAARPGVLVMDEPLVHLDESSRRRCWAVVRDELEKWNGCVIFSTHEFERAREQARQAICLHEGRLVYQGPVRQLDIDPPSAAAAACLGPCLWLDQSDELSGWIKNIPQRSINRGFRPDQIEWAESADGSLQVRSVSIAGSEFRCETEFEPVAGGPARRVVHRYGANRPEPGRRGILKWIGAVLCLMIGLVSHGGCSDGDQTPLHYSKIETWNIPSEGPTIPAPRAVHVTPDGSVLVLDNAGRILHYEPDGTLRKKWWMPDYQVGKPEGICRLMDGRIAVADTHYHQVVIFDADGKVLELRGHQGHGPGEFEYPVTVMQDPAGFLYVGEYGGNDRVQKFTPEGRFVASIGSFGTGPGQFGRLSGVVWWQGNLYITDAVTHRVQVFTDAGKFTGVLGEEPGSSSPIMLKFPYDIALGPKSRLHVIEYGAGRLTVLERSGKMIGRLGTLGSAPGQFSTPWGLSVAGDGTVFVADTGNHRVVVLRP